MTISIVLHPSLCKTHLVYSLIYALHVHSSKAEELDLKTIARVLSIPADLIILANCECVIILFSFLSYMSFCAIAVSTPHMGGIFVMAAMCYWCPPPPPRCVCPQEARVKSTPQPQYIIIITRLPNSKVMKLIGALHTIGIIMTS